MNPERFFTPRMGMNMVPMMSTNYLPSRGIGLFGRIRSGLKSFDWGNLLNNANKTINVVNQTIPLVRQAGPMFNNMKSMFKIAKAFGNETSSNASKNRNPNRGLRKYSNNNSHNVSADELHNENNGEISMQKKEVSNNNYPNFFI